MTVPAMIEPTSGEVVRLVDAGDLLRVAGLEGEQLQTAELERLGDFADATDHLIGIAREARGIVGRETVRRMDRQGSWTIRAGGFEFKASSPTAGTIAYDADVLRAELMDLVAQDLIDMAGADAACEPRHGTVALTLEQLDAIAAGIGSDADDEDRITAAQLLVHLRTRIPDTTYTPKANGIKALLKVGGQVAEAIGRAATTIDPPARTATIKRTSKDDTL